MLTFFRGKLNLAIFLVTVVLIMPSFTEVATLYWVGGAGDDVTVNANDWNTTDPSACSDAVEDTLAVLGSSDIAVFDADCDNSAVIGANWSVVGVSMVFGYVGALTQNSGFTLTVGTSDWI